MPDILFVAARALSFVFLLQAAGIVFFLAIFGNRLSASRSGIRRLGRVSALVGLVFVAGHFGLEAARMAGDLSGVLDVSLQKIALSSPAGVAFAVRALGLTLIAIGFHWDGKLASVLSIVGASLAIGAFTLMGHTATHHDRWFMGVLLLIHLLVVAFWFGALLPLLIAIGQESSAGTGKLVEAFSALAAWLVPGILVAGVLLVAWLVPGWHVFQQPYGELLITKLAAFLVLMGLAAWNKWRLGPAIVRGEVHALLLLRRSVMTEYAFIVGVLAVTASMTTFFSPE